MKKKMRKRRTNLIITITIISLILIAIFIIILIKKTDIKQENIREASFAGSWYPANEEQLEKSINNYLENSQKIDFDGRGKKTGKYKFLSVPRMCLFTKNVRQQ